MEERLMFLPKLSCWRQIDVSSKVKWWKKDWCFFQSEVIEDKSKFLPKLSCWRKIEDLNFLISYCTTTVCFRWLTELFNHIKWFFDHIDLFTPSFCFWWTVYPGLPWLSKIFIYFMYTCICMLYLLPPFAFLYSMHMLFNMEMDL